MGIKIKATSRWETKDQKGAGRAHNSQTSNKLKRKSNSKCLRKQYSNYIFLQEIPTDFVFWPNEENKRFDPTKCVLKILYLSIFCDGRL